MIATLRTKLQSKIANDKHFAELIKGSGIAFILRIVGIAAGYIFTLLVTRTLGAESWGIFSLSLVVLQIASVVGRLGMDTALLRFTAEYTAKGELNTLKEIYKKALTLVLPFSTLVAFSVYFLSPVLAVRIFHKPYLTDYFRIVSFIIVPFILLLIHSEAVRGLKKVKEYMFLQNAGIFIISNFLLLLILPLNRSNYLPLFSYGFSVIILTFMAMYLWYKFLGHVLLKVDMKNYSLSYKFLLNISLPMFFSGSLSLIMGWIDTVILGIFRSSQEVGIFNVLVKVSALIGIVLLAVNTVAAPKFVEFWQREDIPGLLKFSKKATKLTFWLSMPVVLLLLLFPSFVLGLFGKDFTLEYESLRILLVGQLVNVMAGSVGYILLMTGHQRYHQNVLATGVIGNTILNTLLIPKYGILGAAVVNMLTVIYWNLLFSIKVYRILGGWIFYPNFRRT